MNIKEYYTVMSRIYLNQVILSGFFLLICLYFTRTTGFLFILNVICCIVIVLLLYFFSRYLYFLKKENAAVMITEKKKIAINSNELMMLFLPAPSLAIKFFLNNGICDGELHDQDMGPWKWFLPSILRKKDSKTYIFKKRDGISLAAYTLHHHPRTIEMVINQNKKVIIELLENRKKMITFKAMEKIIKIEKSNHKIEFTRDNQKIANIQTGWMPIKWQRYFSPNTPILSFQDELDQNDRFLIYGLLIYLFANQYH